LSGMHQRCRRSHVNKDSWFDSAQWLNKEDITSFIQPAKRIKQGVVKIYGCNATSCASLPQMFSGFGFAIFVKYVHKLMLCTFAAEKCRIFFSNLNYN
jgi:hypothetical protein